MPSLNLLVLRTTDMDALRNFYETLGIEFQQERHGKGPEHFATEMDGLVFEIYPLKAGQTADTTTRLGFRVQNLDTTFAAIQEANGHIVREPRDTPWGRQAIAKDSDGRTVELYLAD